jgi:hypothetical protein
MCCERLVCAACAGPVSEARCATCRSAKAELHIHPTRFPVEMALLFLVVLTLLTLVVQGQS